MRSLLQLSQQAFFQFIFIQLMQSSNDFLSMPFDDKKRAVEDQLRASSVPNPVKDNALKSLQSVGKDVFLVSSYFEVNGYRNHPRLPSQICLLLLCQNNLELIAVLGASVCQRFFGFGKDHKALLKDASEDQLYSALRLAVLSANSDFLSLVFDHVAQDVASKLLADDEYHLVRLAARCSSQLECLKLLWERVPSDHYDEMLAGTDSEISDEEGIDHDYDDRYDILQIPFVFNQFEVFEWMWEQLSAERKEALLQPGTIFASDESRSCLSACFRFGSIKAGCSLLDFLSSQHQIIPLADANNMINLLTDAFNGFGDHLAIVKWALSGKLEEYVQSVFSGDNGYLLLSICENSHADVIDWILARCSSVKQLAELPAQYDEDEYANLFEAICSSLDYREGLKSFIKALDPADLNELANRNNIDLKELLNEMLNDKSINEDFFNQITASLGLISSDEDRDIDQPSAKRSRLG